MGVGTSAFTDKELDEYRELTRFSKAEILHLHSRFKALDPETVNEDREAPISMDRILADLPELCVNPFKYRICKVFSSSGDGALTFEDFLDLAAAFGENSSRNSKIEWAFKIYDFDEDNQLGKSDLRKMIDLLCGSDSPLGESEGLEAGDVKIIVNNVIKEADLDEDGKLNFSEFQLLVSKMPDFADTFRIRF
jgi:calcium and integrin-binding protein 1